MPTARTSRYIPGNMLWDGSITNTNKYWYDRPNWNAGAQNSLCLPNCTTYARGRLAEISGIAETIFGSTYGGTGFPGAENWYDLCTWTKHPAGDGYVPKIGDIACWNNNSAAYDGHVAIVENVINGVVYVSQSRYRNATSGSRSFTNPGDIGDVYFEYRSMVTYTGTTFEGYLVNPHTSPTPPVGEPSLTVTPSSYNVVMGGDSDYVDFPFDILMENIPLDEGASGGNTYPDLTRVYNTGWQYTIHGNTRDANKQQTLRYHREHDYAYDITKYMYYDKTFSNGRVTGTYPMTIHVREKGQKGIPLFLEYDGGNVTIR